MDSTINSKLTMIDKLFAVLCNGTGIKINISFHNSLKSRASECLCLKFGITSKIDSIGVSQDVKLTHRQRFNLPEEFWSNTTNVLLFVEYRGRGRDQFLDLDSTRLACASAYFKIFREVEKSV